MEENYSNSQEISTSNTPAIGFSSNSNKVISEKHTASWIIILLLLFLYPVAWYFMYKEKKYHKWFAYLLWITAGISLAMIFLPLIFIVPQLVTLYINLNVPIQPMTILNIQISYLILTVISIAEIIVGIKLYKKTKDQFSTYKKLLNITIWILIFDLLFGSVFRAYPIWSIITPIYTLMSSIQ